MCKSVLDITDFLHTTDTLSSRITWRVDATTILLHPIYGHVHHLFFFFNQQFITQRAVADRGSYFVTTYRRCRLHVEEETEEGKRYIEEREKKRTNRKVYVMKKRRGRNK